MLETVHLPSMVLAVISVPGWASFLQPAKTNTIQIRVNKDFIRGYNYLNI
jgi:hypothetical protein